jgi:hypothetical protein
MNKDEALECIKRVMYLDKKGILGIQVKESILNEILLNVIENAKERN